MNPKHAENQGKTLNISGKSTDDGAKHAIAERLGLKETHPSRSIVTEGPCLLAWLEAPHR